MFHDPSARDHFTLENGIAEANCMTLSCEQMDAKDLSVHERRVKGPGPEKVG